MMSLQRPLINNNRTGISVLVIDQATVMLDLFAAILQDEEFVVSCHRFDDYLLEDIDRLKPDILIWECDLGVEKVEWSMLQKFIAKNPTQHSPVIITSTRMSLIESIPGLLEDRRILLLEKPFSLETLLSLLERATRFKCG